MWSRPVLVNIYQRNYMIIELTRQISCLEDIRGAKQRIHTSSLYSLYPFVIRDTSGAGSLKPRNCVPIILMTICLNNSSESNYFLFFSRRTMIEGCNKDGPNTSDKFFFCVIRDVLTLHQWQQLQGRMYNYNWLRSSSKLHLLTAFFLICIKSEKEGQKI